MPSTTFTCDVQDGGYSASLRVRDGQISARTNFERDTMAAVPFDRVTSWRLQPHGDLSVCIVFVTSDEEYWLCLPKRLGAPAAGAVTEALGPAGSGSAQG